MQHDEPISNIEQAKRYFISMGCSHFHLCREDSQKAKEYYALKIGSDVESQWRKEVFERGLAEICSCDGKDLWWKYSNLADLMERDSFYLEKMMEVTDKIQGVFLTDQLHLVLNTIIGNNGSKARGGLIQKAFELDRLDLMHRFIAHAKSLLEKAEKAEISLTFIRGYFVDVIEHFKVEENSDYLNQLREKDNFDNFNYYQKGVEEGNKFSMKMLAEYYRNGIGCEKNTEQAGIWQKKANE